MKYKIKWKAKETGATGEGEPIFNTREMARKTANQLNAECPYILHWVESVTDDAEIQDETR